MTFIGALASVFLKKASSAGCIRDIFLSVYLLIGIILYVIAACLNIVVLYHMDYSIVLPLTSITYIWTMILSYLVYKENIGIKKIVGTTLIIIGAIVMFVR